MTWFITTHLIVALLLVASLAAAVATARLDDAEKRTDLIGISKCHADLIGESLAESKVRSWQESPVKRTTRDLRRLRMKR